MSKRILYKQKFHKWYDEDIWGYFSLAKKNSKAIGYLYTSFQHNFQKRKLLKKKRYFWPRKRFQSFFFRRFAYRINTGEVEFKRKKRRVYSKSFFKKKLLRVFYGNLKVRPFRSLLKVNKKGRNLYDPTTPWFLENRLDSLLYRTNLFPSIFAIRVFLRQKNVFVNGKVVTNKNTSVKIGDIIFIKPTVYGELHQNFQKRVKERRLLTNFPKYLEVDYSVGAFTLVKLPKLQEISYPAGVQLKTMLHRYTK